MSTQIRFGLKVLTAAGRFAAQTGSLVSLIDEVEEVLLARWLLQNPNPKPASPSNDVGGWRPGDQKDAKAQVAGQELLG